MADYVISAANLSAIERGLNNLGEGLQTVASGISTVNGRVNEVAGNVRLLEDQVTTLARDFADFLITYNNKTQLTISHTEIVRIRQELEQKYGHYDIVRRTTTGILQANDLGIVRKETIKTAAEDLMLATPNYWLTPCLIALAAWIDDEPKIAGDALQEAIKRNDENTSLFFALVCRRANRKQACLKWVERYLANQDEENLDRNAVIILDAFAGGLLGADSEGVVARQIGKWMDHLADKPNFVNQQTQQWTDAITLKKRPMQDNGYTYLPKYSHTWPILQEIMEGAQLHADILSYFMNIFHQEASTDALKAQLDEILDSLVSNFDEVELPLRKEERLHQLIIDFGGDKTRASAAMALEESAFHEKKDFTQLLTDAAMKPESSHASVSTQKFAIALSKDWIINAYNDITAQNRMKIPYEIEINVDTFNGKTTDGSNEGQLLSDFSALVDREKASALSSHVLSGFETFCLYGGIAVGVIALILLFTDNVLLGLLAMIAGIAMICNHFSKKKAVTSAREEIDRKYEKKREQGKQVIRATVAEIVDFRGEFARKDRESEKVIEFLDQLAPEQYVKKLADSTRRVKVSE
ncbi:MAG: hypothetical protein ACI4V3_10545 [Faecousia sp.]